MKFNFSLGSVLLASGMSIGTCWSADAPQTAAATAAPPESGLELAEVVVTAEKRTSTVQATPLSITALSQDTLQKQGLANIAGIAAATPGISLRTSGPGQTELEMRGLASSGGAAPTVGFYLDETPLTPAAAALNGKTVVDPDLFDLNRVEVLRGPQGTLYGAGSMGGTIKLVSNPPELNKFSAATEAIFSGTAGGGFNPGGNLMLNIPLRDDTLALRVVATEKYTHGWLDRIVLDPFPVGPGGNCGFYVCTRGNVTAAPVEKTTRDVNWVQLDSARATLLFQPTDSLKIVPMVMYQRITSGGPTQFDAPPGPGGPLAHFQPFDIPEPFSDKFLLYSLTVTKDFPGAQLTSASSYYSRTQRQTGDSTEALESLLGEVFGMTQFVSTPITETDSTIQRNQELRLASTGNGPFQWIFGGYFSSFQSVYDDLQANPIYGEISTGGPAANPDGLEFQAHNPYSVKQYAAFGETSYQLTNALKGTVGLRWFKYDSSMDFEQSGLFSQTGNASQFLGQVKASASGLNPKFNLAYLPSKDLTLYASIAKGFRPGGVNLPAPPALCGTDIPLSYQPDTIWNYEVGEKARMLQGRLQVNADVYYIKWSGIQQFLNTPTCGFPYSGNAGNARSFGPELEVTAHLNENFTAAFNGTYTKSEITSVNPASQGLQLAANQVITAGTPIENVPKYTVGMSLTYERSLFADYELSARVADSIVGPFYDISYNFEPLPSYNLLDLRVSLSHDKWRVSAFADNLANKHAQLGINTTTYSLNVPNLTRVATNQPRTIGIDLFYRL